MATAEIDQMEFRKIKKESPYRNFQQYPQTDPVDYVMKIGKHKGKSLKEIMETTKGKYYIHWFAENIVNKENEKFYGKILKVNQMLIDTKQIVSKKGDESDSESD